MGLAWELVLLLLHALEVRGDVRLAVSRRAEDLLAVGAGERAHACPEEKTCLQSNRKG